VDAECREPLAGDEADAARGRVEQHGLAGLHAVRAADQVLHRQALQHHRRGLLVGDAVGHGDETVGRDDPDFGIRAGPPPAYATRSPTFR
jgi:hypothetical protein